MAKKQPFMKFFVGDWLSDECLRTCSLAARGLWIDLLCLMHKNSRRGYLQQANGKPLSSEQIARVVGCSPEETAHLLQELINSGVASASEAEGVYSRRMVQEAHISEVRRQAGAKGGNPNMTNRGPPNDGLQMQSGNKWPNNSLPSDKEEGETLESISIPIPAGTGEGGGSGAGEDFANANPTQLSPAIDLAQKFAFECTKRRGSGKFYRQDGSDLSGEFAELLRHVSKEKIESEISDPDRWRGEWFGDMANRLLRNHANGTYSGGAYAKRQKQQRRQSGRFNSDVHG